MSNDIFFTGQKKRTSNTKYTFFVKKQTNAHISSKKTRLKIIRVRSWGNCRANSQLKHFSYIFW